MIEVFLAIEIIVAIFLVAVILLQRSEGGALGIGGGGGGGGGGLMSARGAGDLLTRLTAILAAVFIGVSLTLAVLSGQRDDGTSVFDDAVNVTPVQDEDLSSLDDDLGLAEEVPTLPDPEPEPADDDAGATGDQ